MPAAPRRKKPTAPALDDLATRLSDRLETRVKVDLGRSKGKMTIEFASIPDLERIVDVMDPRAEAGGRAAGRFIAERLDPSVDKAMKQQVAMSTKPQADRHTR